MHLNSDGLLSDIDGYLHPGVDGRRFIHQSPLLTPIFELYEELPQNLSASDSYFDIRSGWPMRNDQDRPLTLSDPPTSSQFAPRSEHLHYEVAVNNQSASLSDYQDTSNVSHYRDPSTYPRNPVPTNFLSMTELMPPLQDPSYEDEAVTPRDYSTVFNPQATYSSTLGYSSQPPYSSPPDYNASLDHGTPPANSATPDWFGTSFTDSERSSPVQSIDEKDHVTTSPRKKRPPKQPRLKRNSSESKSDTEKRYYCTWPNCDKSYGKSSHLKPHLNMHNELKPYKCERPGCDEAFYRNDLLQRHIKGPKHDNVKEEKCHFCPRMFRRKDNRTEHEKRAHPNQFFYE